MSNEPTRTGYLAILIAAVVACAIAFHLGRESVARHPQATSSSAVVHLPQDDFQRSKRPTPAPHPSQTPSAVTESAEEKANRLEAKTQQFLDQSQQRHWDQTSAKQAAEYAEVFAALEIPDDVLTNTLRRLRQLHESASALNNASIQMQEKRAAFDAYMKETLPPDAYQKYRNYEERKPAEREASAIRSRLEASGVTINETDLARITDAIAATKTTTTEYWHGPYDPIPHPSVGQQAVTESLQSQKAILEERLQRLWSSLPNEIDPAMLREVTKHYDDKLAEIGRTIERVNRPLSEIRAEKVKELEARIKALRGK